MQQQNDPGVATPSTRLPWREKLGYGIGDFGFNLYWANISAFLLIFYTDVMGLAAGAVGTMLLATKLLDAVTDPLMGAMADRTRTRWAGSARTCCMARCRWPLRAPSLVCAFAATLAFKKGCTP